MDYRNFLDRLSFGQDKRMRFYSMVRDFVVDGISVPEALKEIDAGSREFKMFPPRVLGGLLSAGRSSAKSLGEALRPWVVPIEAALIDAGQSSGRIEVGLSEVVGLMSTKVRIRNTVLGTLVYPVVILVVLGLYLTLLSGELIPNMETAVPRAQWPAHARLLGSIADNVGLIATVVYGGIGAVIAAFLATASTWTGEARNFFDKWVMPWTVYRKIQAAMTLTVIAMMAESGIPIGSAIARLHQIGTRWHRYHLEHMQYRMKKGKTEAESIVGVSREDCSMFGDEQAWEVRLYGKRSAFAACMKNLSTRSIERLEVDIRFQVGIIRNALLVLVAVMLALTVLSFFAVSMAAAAKARAF